MGMEIKALRFWFELSLRFHQLDLEFATANLFGWNEWVSDSSRLYVGNLEFDSSLFVRLLTFFLVTNKNGFVVTNEGQYL